MSSSWACCWAVGLGLGSLACGRPPASDGTTGDEIGCGEPRAVHSETCGDGIVDAGESCLSHAQTLEIDNLPGFPQPLRGELVVADFDGDGIKDLVSGRYALLANQAGTFTVVTADSNIVNPRAIELDGQMGSELVWLESVPANPDGPEPTLGYVRVRFEYGGVDFPRSVPMDMTTGTAIGFGSADWSYSAMDLAVGDVNADGHDDIAVLILGANFDQFRTELILLTHFGAYEYEQVVLDSLLSGEAISRWVSVGSIGGDDFDDLIWAGGRMFHGSESAPTVASSTLDHFGWGVSRVLLDRDFDCDGIPDLLGGNVSGVVAARGLAEAPYLAEDAQQLTISDAGEPTDDPVPWVPWDLADFNADGAGDLVLIGPTGAAIAYAESGGRFAEVTPLETPHPWIAARAVDVDGDGAADLVGVYANPEAQHNTEPISGGLDILLSTP